MELEDLKSDWQNADVAFKNEAELLKMTRIKNHPSIKSIRTKLVIEIISFLLFLTVYYDWFDGDQKPIVVHILLVGSLLLYLANDIIGYISIVKEMNGLNLKASLENYLIKIRRLSVFSLICTLLYSISFLLFFSSVIHFTKEKSFILLFLIIVLFQLLLWSQRTWNKWIKSLEKQVEDFDLEEI